jgi:multiple sugar transport system permease protein
MANLKAAAFAGPVRPLPGARIRYWKDTLVAYLYILPATIILVTFHFFPIFYAFYISLFNWGLIQGSFAGANNYVKAVTSEDFWRALNVTVYYVLGAVPLSLGVGLLVAYLLFQKIRWRSFYRTFYFMPYVMSLVAAAMVWRWLYHPSYGFFNDLLALFGIDKWLWLDESAGVLTLALGYVGIPFKDGYFTDAGLTLALNIIMVALVVVCVVRARRGSTIALIGSIIVGLCLFFGIVDSQLLQLPNTSLVKIPDPSLALASVVIFSTWHHVGFDIVIFLAGLTGISPELYEAARIDGANERQIFRHITFPLLSPTTFFLMIISTIGTFQAFSHIYIMTAGGPMGATRTVTMFLFQNFYDFTRVGYASALAFILFFIILGLTIIQFRLAGRRVEY